MIDVPKDRSQRVLWAVVRVVIAFPRVTLFLASLLVGLAVWYTATHLEFETSRNALVPQNARYIQRSNEAKEDFGSLENIIVVIEPRQFERGKQFVEALAERLRADTRHFASVTAKIDSTALEGKKLLLLTPAELQTLQQRLQDAQELLTEVPNNPGLQQLLVSLNQEISKALVTHLTSALLGSAAPTAPSQAAEHTPSLDVHFLTALFREMAQALAEDRRYVFHSPWEDFFLKDSKILSEEGYLTAKNNRFFFVLVKDRSISGDFLSNLSGGSFVKHAAALQALRGHLQALRQDFPDVQAGVTGGIALTTDEMVASQRDTGLATLLALAAVTLLFLIGFREVWSPLLVVTSLTMATCWTLGFTTLTIGHLNILSITFAPILIGLADNFGVQFVARYGEERTQGHDLHSALALACWHTGPGIVTAAVTVALAFYAVLLADFPGLAELGFIAGSGVLLCLLASFTVLPALLVVTEPYLPSFPGVWKTLPHDPLRILKRSPRTVLGGIGLATLAGILLLPWPRFDYNLLNLQAQGTESVFWEYRLLESATRSSWYATSMVSSIEELHQKKAQFVALPSVERVESLTPFLPLDQAERLQAVEALATYMEPVPDTWGPLAPIEAEALDTLLAKIRFKLQRPASDWEAEKRPSEEGLNAARAALVAVQERLQSLAPEVARQILEPFQQALMADFASKLQLLQHNVHPAGPLTVENVPAYLRERFVGKSGRYLLQIFARENIWEREAMETFVTQLQEVDADITGSPIVAFYATQQMQQGYLLGGLYALVIIVGITFWHFRRLQPTLLALVPLVLGALWMIPWMALFGVSFNMANLVVFPLFMGMAMDCGIHLLDRALETPETAASPMAQSTGKAVLVSGLTTVCGFGSLMVAQHAGIFSFGVLLTLAVSSNLLAAFVVLPLLLQLFPLPATGMASVAVASESSATAGE